MITNIQQLDIHKSMLLIGIGATNKYLKEIVIPEYPGEAREVFGDSEFVDMYELLAKDHESYSICLMNLEVMHDYLSIEELLASHDFSYVIPLDVNLSDFYFDPLNNGRKTFYLQNVIDSSLRHNNRTIFLVTDKHASLYKNIDLFLDEMHKNEIQFRENAETRLAKESLIFVANNLANIPFANVVLARMILNTEPDAYPTDSGESYQSIFSIDRTDNIGSMAYFKTHANRITTIENLLNFGDENSPTKIYTIYRICLYIAKELDQYFSEYVGSHYLPYKLQRIEMIVRQYMENLIGTYLISYEIEDVYAEEDPYHAGTVNIYLKYSIWPVGCAEQFIPQILKVVS